MSNMKVFKEISNSLDFPDYFSNLDGDTVAIWNGFNGGSFKVIQKDFYFDGDPLPSQYIVGMSFPVELLMGMTLQDATSLMPPQFKMSFHEIKMNHEDNFIERKSFASDSMSASELMEWFKKNLDTIRKVLDAA